MPEPEGWRAPPDCPGYLLHGDTKELWSCPREVPGKGGSTRRIAAKHIKPSRGRVSMSIDGARVTFSINRLWAETFPELVDAERAEKYLRTIRRCKNGHPLADLTNEIFFDKQGNILPSRPEIEPQVSHWGSFNRICRLCIPDAPERFGRGNYSSHYGTTGIDDSPSHADRHYDSQPGAWDGAAEWMSEGSHQIVTRPE